MKLELYLPPKVHTATAFRHSQLPVPEELASAAAAGAAAADRPEGSLSPEAGGGETWEKRWGRGEFMEKTWEKHGKFGKTRKTRGKYRKNHMGKAMKKRGTTIGKGDGKTGNNHGKQVGHEMDKFEKHVIFSPTYGYFWKNVLHFRMPAIVAIFCFGRSRWSTSHEFVAW